MKNYWLVQYWYKNRPTEIYDLKYSICIKRAKKLVKTMANLHEGIALTIVRVKGEKDVRTDRALINGRYVGKIHAQDLGVY